MRVYAQEEVVFALQAEKVRRSSEGNPEQVARLLFCRVCVQLRVPSNV